MPKSIASIALVLVLFLAPSKAGAASEEAAREFVRTLIEDTIDVLRQPDLTSSEITASLREQFRQGFDVATIGRFVLGRHWRTATPEQREEYLALFEDLVVETYATRFRDYSGETVRINGSRPEGGSDVLVQSQLVRPQGPPVDVTWRVRERGGEYRIVDVLVGGVSMTLTQRSEFSSVVQRSGGNIDALLDAIRNQIQNIGRS